VIEITHPDAERQAETEDTLEALGSPAGRSVVLNKADHQGETAARRPRCEKLPPWREAVLVSAERMGLDELADRGGGGDIGKERLPVDGGRNSRSQIDFSTFQCSTDDYAASLTYDDADMVAIFLQCYASPHRSIRSLKSDWNDSQNQLGRGDHVGWRTSLRRVGDPGPREPMIGTLELTRLDRAARVGS
jgi:hypothetical protein